METMYQMLKPYLEVEKIHIIKTQLNLKISYTFSINTSDEKTLRGFTSYDPNMGFPYTCSIEDDNDRVTFDTHHDGEAGEMFNEIGKFYRENKDAYTY